MRKRAAGGSIAWLSAIALAHCSSTTTPVDSGIDATTDTPVIVSDAPAEIAACAEVTAIHSLYPGPLYLRAHATASIRLRLARDRGICGADFALASGDASVVMAPTSVHVDVPHAQVEFTVTAGAPGRTTLRAVQNTPPDPSGIAHASIDVIVLDATVPACALTTAPATGMLAAGTSVAGAPGSALAAASVALPVAAVEVTPRAVSIACAMDQVPAGYDAIGPAVTFGPAGTRFGREVPFTVPVNPALVPPMFELQTEVAYTGPGVAAGRIVALANTRFAPGGTALEFSAPRMGTYQAVVRHGLGTHHVTRHLTNRAILGISMGAIGSSLIGTLHPELFDVIAPLGGPADGAYSSSALHDRVFGGFCTAGQRAMLGDAACAAASTARTPPVDDLFVALQNFESFNEAPGGGTGGTFDRAARFVGFRDIARAFGDSIMPTDPANGILPLGVPASELTRSDADRCATPVVLGGGAGDPRFYDDEYNPDGAFPVITFCDGNSVPGMPGVWAGGQGTTPVEIALAVDRNRNGVRDAGEPVIRDFSEPFRDVGSDGLASANEPGYDAMNNPDPNGDDFDRQYNPAGTEGNFLRDSGEPFDDFGLDGVRCPAGHVCPYDVGEGNGVFDTTGGLDQGLHNNPRMLYATLPQATAHRLGVWADGGVRDALQFGVNANHFVGAVSQQGEALHLFNGFSSLLTGHDPPANSDDGYQPQDVDFDHVPRHSLMRYGFVDASAAQIAAGDGAHVGTGDQIANRLETAAWWVQSQWATGDRGLTAYSAQPDDAGRCANGYFCSFDFHSDRARRTGPVAVYLPPGYHRAANASVRYPVIFFLHGYGMQPMDLLATGFILGTQMVSGQLAEWQRPQKFIMVFPDGRCRPPDDDCLGGTFYADSPNGRTRATTFFLDLYDYVNTTFRTRAAEDVDVVE